jgi:hypothetical protein
MALPYTPAPILNAANTFNMKMEVVYVGCDGLPEHIGSMDIKEEALELVQEQLPSSLLVPVPIIILN